MEVGKSYVVVFDDLGRSQRKVLSFVEIKEGIAQFYNLKGRRKKEFIPVSRIIRIEEENDDGQLEL